MKSFRVWLFEAQGGACYLGTTKKCQARSRAMRLGGKHKNDYASWEHVIPRAKQKPGEPSLKLLACCNCNNAKGARDPEPEHVDLARRLEAEYRAFWWARLSPRAQTRWLGRIYGVTEPQASQVIGEALPAAVVLELSASALMRARKRARVANAVVEAEARRRKAALGLDQYEDSTKAWSKLRRAATAALGR